MSSETTLLVDGLMFPETPRWHDGKLWFSDMVGRKVMTVDLSGKTEVIVEVPKGPSGLGWLPDGRLLVVSITDRRLMRLDPDGLNVAADLSDLATFNCNDMVVDGQGRAYVGNFGYDALGGKPFAPATLILVTPDGKARIIAEDMAFPNGTVITPDGKTLIVGESRGSCLTAFDIESDGSLSHRRVWAQLEKGHMPDGTCLDAEGAVWVTSPGKGEVLRVHEGGTISRIIKGMKPAFACMLGGTDRRTLFLCTAISAESFRGKASGQIEQIQVDVPGAGWP
ncbi:MAG: SMP-30/gluconolactonase/LRE family protein [Desulfobacteraceae bacterium]|nr:SMP-30/gluconolactonase/LRE family protein [Desulfobacteraceae bacterium]